MDSSRVLAVQARLDAARDKLQAELDKGAARDKSLVTSYEKSIEELKDELKMHTSTVGTREPGDLKHILKQLMDAMQDNMSLARLVLRGQLRPSSSSASTKRLEHYRLAAIEYYYGSDADKSKIRCMVTGEEVDSREITAGHIYRHAWPTGLLNVMGCKLHEPRNIVLMQKQLEKRFDNWDWTIVPEGPDAFRVHVLNPHLLDPKGREQYVTGHTGKGTTWRDVNNTLLHLPPIAHPARRLCGLHATLAVQEADTKGWFDEKHEAPEMSEASWQSPSFDHLLMKKYLTDETANIFDAETASGSGD
ncbi:TPA: hypothetical protein ACH3X1_001335 [Trebouxia sp. C0004]